MSNTIKLTVIVPIYNSAPYLRRCLDSIVSQTYRNLEIILVDDGSCDDSGKIIDEYAKVDNRIIALHKENGGIGSAYNLAFPKMTGDYITFVDSDDYLEIIAYEELLKMAKSIFPDLIHFGLTAKDQNGQIVKKYETIDDTIEGTDKILSIHFEKLKHPSPVRIYKKNLFGDIFLFNQNIGIDEMLTPQLLSRCKKAIYTSKSFYNITIREDSISRSVINNKKINETIKVYRFICNFVENKIPDYSPFVQLKYLTILNSFYYQALADNKLMEQTTYNEVISDAKSYLSRVRKSAVYKATSLPFRAMVQLMVYYPFIYKLLYKFRHVHN